MKKYLLTICAAVVITLTGCANLSVTEDSNTGNDILADASASASAMQMYYYDGAEIKCRTVYDPKAEEQILKKLHSGKAESVSGNGDVSFSVPAYGFWCAAVDGTDLYVAMSGNTWITGDGNVWNVDADPSEIWDLFSDKDEKTVKSITDFPLQSTLVHYDTAFADKSPSVDTTGLSDVQEGRILVWHDEFDGTAVNSDNWETVGSLASGNFNEDSVKVENSVLHLKAAPLKEGDTAGEWYDPVVIQNPDKGIRQGRIEARIKMDRVNGSNIAFWTMGAGQWPLFGEIDMLETYPDGTFASALHWFNGSPWNNSQVQPGWGAFDGEYHIYAVEMKGTNLTLFVDDKQLWTYDTSSISDYYEGVNPFENMLKVIKFDIGFWDKNTIPSDTKEINMWVDWVREYAPEDVTDPDKELVPTAVSLRYIGKDGRAVMSKDGKSAELNLNDAAVFMPVYTPETVEQRAVTIVSSDPEVADAMGDFTEHSGLILGKKEGKTTLTVTDVKTGVKSTLELTVTDHSEKKKSVSGANLDSVELGDEAYWFANGLYSQNYSVIRVNGQMNVIPSSKYTFQSSIQDWVKSARFMRVYFFDEKGKDIGYEELQPGDSFTVPANAVTAVPEISWYTGEAPHKGTFYTQLMSKINSGSVHFFEDGSAEFIQWLNTEGQKNTSEKTEQ